MDNEKNIKNEFQPKYERFLGAECAVTLPEPFVEREASYVERLHNRTNPMNYDR